jgi:hypothetical protein
MKLETWKFLEMERDAEARRCVGPTAAGMARLENLNVEGADWPRPEEPGMERRPEERKLEAAVDMELRMDPGNQSGERQADDRGAELKENMAGPGGSGTFRVTVDPITNSQKWTRIENGERPVIVAPKRKSAVTQEDEAREEVEARRTPRKLAKERLKLTVGDIVIYSHKDPGRRHSHRPWGMATAEESHDGKLMLHCWGNDDGQMERPKPDGSPPKDIVTSRIRSERKQTEN